MQFRISLEAREAAIIPINYQYPLSAVIYKILDRADAAYAAFLHDTGYKKTGSPKAFKLFTFSDLKTPFEIIGDRLQLLGRQAELIISFHLPQAAETFIKGLFMNQQIEIADKRSKASFVISQVEVLPLGLSQDEWQEITVQPMSPIVCGKKDERGNYKFLSPEHPEFVRQLMHNWKEKCKTVFGAEKTEEAFKGAGIEVLLRKNAPKSRLITLKANTTAETKIRGFVNFDLKLLGKKEALELLMDCGVGVYNGVGMGGVMVDRIV